MSLLDQQIKNYVLKPDKGKSYGSRILEDENGNKLGMVYDDGGTLNFTSKLVDSNGTHLLQIEERASWREVSARIKDSNQNHIGNITKNGGWGSKKYIQIEDLEGKLILKNEMLGSRKSMKIMDDTGIEIGNLIFTKRTVVDFFNENPPIWTLTVKNMNFNRFFLLGILLYLAHTDNPGGG